MFIAEVKGFGHPDEVCNSLSQAYAKNIDDLNASNGSVVSHYNLDKVYIKSGDIPTVYIGGNIVFMDEYTMNRVKHDLENITKRYFTNLFKGSSVHTLFNWDCHFNENVTSNLSTSSIKQLWNDTSYISVESPRVEVTFVNQIKEKYTKLIESQKLPLGSDFKLMFIKEDYKPWKLIISNCLTKKDTLQEPEILSELNVLFGNKCNITFNNDWEEFGTFYHKYGSSIFKGDCGQNGRGNPMCGLSSPQIGEVNESIWGKNQNHPAIGMLNNAKNVLKRLDDIYLHMNIRHRVTLVSIIGKPLDEYEILIEQLK